jgi:hypothetical protein
MWEERSFHINIEERLDEVCSDNPLDSLKNTNHELIVIKLKNPNDEINVPNRILYSIRDVEEFPLLENIDLASKFSVGHRHRR